MAFDGTLKFDTAIDQAGFKTGLEGLGKVAKAGMTAVAGAVTAASGAVVAIGKSAVEAYADFEQLAGGVETLFGDAAQTVMENAAQAFRTAGMSANDYMETATASAAAMIGSLAGDTVLAAKLTDMAVTDMSDNINKMGSSAESVQNAYAGFAKGNFTMLDNLKLGYGGTKQEMERLLETAQKLSGVEYSIDSYADIVRAIHAVQENMGITGTTAEEAEKTISGSVAMVRAAWDNLLVGVADDTQDFDKLTDDLVSSVDAAASNILPRAEQAFGGVVRLVDGLSDDAVRLLTDVAGYAPLAVDAGLNLMDAFTSGIREHLPELLETGLSTGLELLNGFGDLSVQFLDVGAELAKRLDAGLERDLPRITGTAREILLRIIKALGDRLPDVLTAGAEITEMLLHSLSDDLPRYTAFGNRLILQIAEALRNNAPNLLGLVKNLIGAFGSAILSSLPVLLDCAVQVIDTVVDVISDPDDLTALIGAAVLILQTLGGALIGSVQPLTDAAVQIILTLAQSLADPEALSSVADTAVLMVTALGMALMMSIPLLLSAGAEVLSSLIEALSDPEALNGLLDAGLSIVTMLAEILVGNLSPLVGAVIAIIGALGAWLGEHALDLVEAGLAIVQALLDAVIQNLPLLLGAAVQIIEALCRGIEEDSDDVLIAVEQILRTLLDFLLSPDTIRMVGQAGGKIIRALVPAAKELAADLLGFAYDLFTEYGEALLTPDWGEIGKSIVYGILDGLLGVDFDAELFKSDFAENWVSGIKDIFGIHSPSKLMRDQIGKNLALGVEVGFDENIPDTLEIPSRFELTKPQVDPAALEALRMSPMPDASSLVPQSATSIVNNSYQYNSSSSTTNSTTTTTNAPNTPVPTGDIIIPVQIGGENVETLVITAAQIANARSGGATI